MAIPHLTAPFERLRAEVSLPVPKPDSGDNRRQHRRSTRRSK
jgi:hypothetical protein